MIKASPTPAPPIFFEPTAIGIDVEEATYLDWLMAGGERIPSEDDRAWRDTEKDTL